MKSLACSIISVFLLSGCFHYYYVPNAQNVPLMKEKNEFRMAAIYGIGDESESGEVQAAYALTDHVGVAANFIFAKGVDNTDHDFGRGACFDGALGYFKPVSDDGVFEVYGGLGGGSERHEYGYSDGYDGNPNSTAILSSDLNFFKFYAQPAFGISTNLFEVALSARLTGISFTDVISRNTAGTYIGENLDYLEGRLHFFAEPAITLRVGWENVRAQFQYIYSGSLGSSNFDLFEKQHISFGVSFAFAGRYK